MNYPQHKMKSKILLYIFSVIGISLAFFLIGWFLHQPAQIPASTVNLKIEKSEIAKLNKDGQELKIITNSYFASRNFIFLDNKTNDIVTTLSVDDPARGWPSYRIVKGHTHDWLVVTRMGSWGTGMQYNYDEWYFLSQAGTMKMVLTYPSGGNEVAPGFSENKYWRTDILNESYTDDSAVDIKQTTKTCSINKDGENYGTDKECSETSKTTHYVWDESKEKFTFKKQ